MIHQDLIKARKDKGLTQSALAAYAGVTQSMLSRFEKGEDMRLSTVKRIAQALDMRVMAVPKNKYEFVRSLSHQLSDVPADLIERYQVKEDET